MVESALIDSITAEAIQWAGMDLFYIPRKLNKLDRIYGEDTLSSFDLAIPIEMYMETAQGFSGENEMIARFGLEIRASATLVVSRTRFSKSVTALLPQERGLLADKPLEGDLIYDPVTKGLFEIRFVDTEDPFYQTGKRFVWKLQVEKFQFNNEDFSTGLDDIDTQLNSFVNQNRLNYGYITPDGFQLLDEDSGVLIQEEFDADRELTSQEFMTYGENSELKKEFLQIQDFTTDNPFGDGF